MTVDDMRWDLNKAYPGTDWLADVACMNNTEVRECYQRCIANGRLTKKEKK